MTLPAAFRKKLGLQQGDQVQVTMRGNELIVRKNDWKQGLDEVHEEVAAYLKKRNIKPLSDEELDDAINEAAEQGATEHYLQSLDQNQ